MCLTPTAGGTYPFTIHVAGGTSSANLSYTITVGGALTITTASPLPTGTVGTSYPAVTLAASGGSGTYTSWSVTAGVFPNGLAFSPSTGSISGTPTVYGTFTFTVTVAD